MTLQFRDAATGRLIASRALPPGTFGGITPDTLDGRPVADVRYNSSSPADEQRNNGDPLPVTAVYSTAGTKLWSSAPVDTDDLATDSYGFPVLSAGYLDRTGEDDEGNVSEDTITTTSGHTVLTLHDTKDSDGDLAHVTLADGYALASWVSSDADGTDSAMYFTLYDLAHGGTQAGHFTEPIDDTSGAAAATELLAVSDGRALIEYPGPGYPGDAVVYTLATGKASTPVDVPNHYDTALIDLADQRAVVYGTGSSTDGPGGPSYGIDLTTGKLDWAQSDDDTPLLPVSAHGGTVYGEEFGDTDTTLVTATESTGDVVSQDSLMAPLAFTSSGDALFAETPSEASGPELVIGMCPPTR